ncbi:MAG: MG2 domain-containing protein, partial [Salinivirgaceae bacterium]
MKSILWLVLIPFFGFLWSGEPDNDLNQMLEEAKSLEQKRKFKSAVALAIEIQEEARRQDRDIIFVKAVDIEISANRWFGFETFKDALQRFDEHIGNGFGRTEALLRIYKIQGYATYYNQHKRQLADNIHDNILNEDPALWSKYDIWKLINREINAILALDGNDNLSEKEIQFLGNIDKLDNVIPRKVSDYALLSGIEALTTFDGDFIVGEDAFYAPVQKFTNHYAKANDSHPNYLIANYYARLLKNQAKSDELLVNHINLQRLQKLFNKDDRFVKLHLYEKALKPLAKYSSPSMSLASARLADIYNGYAQMHAQKEQLRKAHEWQQKAIELCETGLKQYPKSYGAIKCKELLTSIKLPDLEVKLSQNVLPRQLIPAKFNVRNLVALTIEAYRVSASTYMANFVNKTDLKTDNLEHVWTHAIDVPQQNGYFDQSFIDGLPEFQEGFYYIRVTSYRKDKGGNGSETSFYVNASSINSIVKTETDATALHILHAKTGDQLPSANVELVVREYNYKTREQRYVVKEKVPVTNGIAMIERNQRVDYIQVTNGADTLVTHFTSNYIRSRESQENKKLQLFTDRRIYRPGQIIHFKGIIALQADNNYQAIANENVSISLMGTNYKVLQEQKVTSNNYGSFHGMFQIPEQTRPGTMLIRTPYGSTGVEIQYYKRPSFNVEWSKKSELVRPGESVKLPLKVESYAGAAIANAVVKSTITVSSSFFRHWHFFSNDQLVATHTDTTNNAGQATVAFSSLANDDAQRYTIKTTVTLPDGTSREFVKHFTVAPNPLVVQLSDNSNVL